MGRPHGGARWGCSTSPWAPSGRHPLFDGDDVVVRVAGEQYRFTTRLDGWRAFACAVAGRDLTSAEWSDAFGAAPYRETCTS